MPVNLPALFLLPFMLPRCDITYGVIQSDCRSNSLLKFKKTYDLVLFSKNARWGGEQRGNTML